jgi:hypothetical protein
MLYEELLMMLKIKISEIGKKESKKLNFDVEKYLVKIIEYIPKTDLIGLEHIYITDLPHQWKKHLDTAAGAYFQKHKSTSAYIEIYLSRMFSHIKSAESMNRMIPIQNVGLARTVFHEVGHHIEKTRSHRIKKNKSENFADNYAKDLLSKYQIGNADSINLCFENLEKIAGEKGLSIEIIERMKKGWEEEFKSINK